MLVKYFQSYAFKLIIILPLLIERLALKIPYTNLWNNPTTVHIKGVFLLAIPNQAVKYDEAKEKQAIKEAKQKQLSLIEEAKLRAQLIGKYEMSVFLAVTAFLFPCR